MAFPYSSVIVAGTNATKAQYDNLRKDALTRWFKFEVIGTLVVGNGQGGSFILPYAGTVISHRLKTTSGTATVRTNADATVIDSSMAASSTASQDTSVGGTAAVTAGQKLTMDITGVSSGVDLIVEVEILCSP